MKFYLISPPKKNIFFRPDNIEIMSEILPFSFFQFRPKHKTLRNRIKFVDSYYEKISEICKKKKIKMIINNDFEIAEKFDFDGIPLGQTDKSCHDAKRKFGEKFIVGVSCSDSMQLYKKAEEQNADYVAFGPVFNTTSKNKNKINLNKLSLSLKNLRLPFTLIGGINHNNFMTLTKLKPNNLATINAFWNYPSGPIRSAIRFRQILKDISLYENEC